MLRLAKPQTSPPKCDGVRRREFLQVGSLALGGLTLPHLLQARAAAAANGQPVRNTSVILLFLDGGAPQHETFDPKLDAPREYHSFFGGTQTRTPGIHFGSHFQRLATQTQRMSILRTLTLVSQSSSHRISPSSVMGMNIGQTVV